MDKQNVVYLYPNPDELEKVKTAWRLRLARLGAVRYQEVSVFLLKPEAQARQVGKVGHFLRFSQLTQTKRVNP